MGMVNATMVSDGSGRGKVSLTKAFNETTAETSLPNYDDLVMDVEPVAAPASPASPSTGHVVMQDGPGMPGEPAWKTDPNWTPDPRWLESREKGMEGGRGEYWDYVKENLEKAKSGEMSWGEFMASSTAISASMDMQGASRGFAARAAGQVSQSPGQSGQEAQAPVPEAGSAQKDDGRGKNKYKESDFAGISVKGHGMSLGGPEVSPF